jgi:hypothetical protein
VVDGIVRNVDSLKQILNPVVVDEIVQNVKTEFLNPVIVDGIVRNVNSS